jgi:malate synthase
MATRRTKGRKSKAKRSKKAGAKKASVKAGKTGPSKASGRAKSTKSAGTKPAATKPTARKPTATNSAASKLAGTRSAGEQRSRSRRSKPADKARTAVAARTAARRAAAAPASGPASRQPGGSAVVPRPRKAAGRHPGGRSIAVPGVVIGARLAPRYDEILTPQALGFIADLHRKFDSRRRRLLAVRAERQKRFDAGALPDFLAQTRTVRDRDWTVAPIPSDLLDRRVEITGPVDRKMVINALNSRANVYMADFEDANSPTWDNNVEGQLNLKDRWSGRLAFTDPATGKDYSVGSHPAVLIVRPRGWHLVERHLGVDGEAISGALFDFGLYVFHNAKAAIEHGSGPYVYLPKLETHQEARLWNDVFVYAQHKLGIATGTIKATVLIETLPAAFEMDEILYELRDHVVGLNAGRWDYIFSFIKKFANNPKFVLPDRSQVDMGRAFLRAYALLLIKTCHRRRAFAMGGMAAQIPIKNNPLANQAAFAKVRADKEREATDGHDGTWVAHPDLVPVAKVVFDRRMPSKNQIDRMLDVEISRDMLLEVPTGTKTEAGFRENIRVGVQYLEAWLRGRGAVPIYNLMEDAATAEISRAQIWQWLKYGAELHNGLRVTPEFFERALKEEMERVRSEIGSDAFAAGRFADAGALFRRLSLAPHFEEFLTIPAYDMIA